MSGDDEQRVAAGRPRRGRDASRHAAKVIHGGAVSTYQHTCAIRGAYAHRLQLQSISEAHDLMACAGQPLSYLPARCNMTGPAA